MMEWKWSVASQGHIYFKFSALGGAKMTKNERKRPKTTKNDQQLTKNYFAETFSVINASGPMTPLELKLFELEREREARFLIASVKHPHC